MNMDGPGFPRMALGLAWLGAVVATAVVAGYVGGPPGRMLFGVAAVEVIVLAAVVSNKGRPTTLALSALAGTMVIAAGVMTAAIAALTGDATPGRVVVIAAVLTVAGLVTGRMTRRARLMVEGQG